MFITADQLRNAVVEPGLVSAADFDDARKEAEKKGLPIDVVLVDKNLIPDDYLGQIVAEALGYPFAKLGKEKILDHVLRIVPERVARRSKVIAFSATDDTLKVALRDPGDLEMVRLLEKKTGKHVMPFFATERSMSVAIEKYASDLDAAMKTLLESSDLLTKTVEEREKGRDRGDAEDETVITAVQLILNYAYQHGASDVHIEPREKEVV